MRRPHYALAVAILAAPVVASLLALSAFNAHHVAETSRLERTIAQRDAALQADDALLLAYSVRLRSTAASVTVLTREVALLRAENAAVAEDNASLVEAAWSQPETRRPPVQKRRVVKQPQGVEAWRPVVAAEVVNLRVPKAERAWLTATCLRVIRAESGGRADARNGDCLGLLQLDSGWGPTRVRLNGRASIRCFIRSYLRGGRAALDRQWTTY